MLYIQYTNKNNKQRHYTGHSGEKRAARCWRASSHHTIHMLYDQIDLSNIMLTITKHNDDYIHQAF